MSDLLLDRAGRRRSPATMPGFHAGRPPHNKGLRYVFTEQGVAMLSGVLRSETAVTVNIAIMRAFVELRRAATSYTAIERRLTDLERETVERLGKHHEQLLEISRPYGN